MFAPPKRNGRPARKRRGPDRVTNESENFCGVPADAPDPKRTARTATTADRHTLSKVTRIRASSGTVRYGGREESSGRWRVGAAVALLAAAIPAYGAGAEAKQFPGIAFNDRGSGPLVVTANRYPLTPRTENRKI